MTALDERPVVGSTDATGDPDQHTRGTHPAPGRQSTTPGATARFVVIGAVPGAGASTVAFAIAAATRSHGYGVDVLDAASPRRSQLRTVCPTVGVALDICADTRLVPAYGEGTQVRYIDSLNPNRRIDAPSSWDSSPATTSARIHVVDVGISAEEIVAGAHDAAGWLTGPQAQSSTVVLVVPTAAMSGNRCEAVLAQWADAGFTGIDQVVAIGATPPMANPLCPLLSQAFAAGQHMPWDAQFQRYGVGDFSTADSRHDSLRAVGHQLIAQALGLIPEPVTGRSRWWHRKNETN